MGVCATRWKAARGKHSSSRRSGPATHPEVCTVSLSSNLLVKCVRLCVCRDDLSTRAAEVQSACKLQHYVKEVCGSELPAAALARAAFLTAVPSAAGGAAGTAMHRLPLGG
jgi:hypothetical protein